VTNDEEEEEKEPQELGRRLNDYDLQQRREGMEDLVLEKRLVFRYFKRQCKNLHKEAQARNISLLSYLHLLFPIVS